MLVNKPLPHRPLSHRNTASDQYLLPLPLGRASLRLIQRYKRFRSPRSRQTDQYLAARHISVQNPDIRFAPTVYTNLTTDKGALPTFSYIYSSSRLLFLVNFCLFCLLICRASTLNRQQPCERRSEAPSTSTIFLQLCARDLFPFLLLDTLQF